MIQIVQVFGALAILAAFVLAQVRILNVRSLPYLILNLVGAAVLAVVAYVEEQWGFLLLESVWSAVSAGSLVSAIRHRAAALKD